MNTDGQYEYYTQVINYEWCITKRPGRQSNEEDKQPETGYMDMSTTLKIRVVVVLCRELLMKDLL